MINKSNSKSNNNVISSHSSLLGNSGAVGWQLNSLSLVCVTYHSNHWGEVTSTSPLPQNVITVFIRQFMLSLDLHKQLTHNVEF